MAETSTFIKLDRNLIRWRWFQKPKTLLVWIWLIMKANVEPHDFEKETIQRGEVATSRKTISKETGLTEDEVRTALNHLKTTGEITSRARSKYQVITILEYNKYQTSLPGKCPGKSPASPRHSPGKSPQYKNVRSKEVKNGKNSCGDTTTTVRVPPSRDDVMTYCEENGIRTDVDGFLSFNAARGWKRGRRKAEDWRPLLEQWVSRDREYNHPEEDDDGLDDFGRPVRKEFK